MPNETWCDPWRTAGPTAGIDDIFVEDCHGNVVARIGRDATPETKQARLDLIVMSPELYELLAECAESLAVMEYHDKEVVKQARTALAKARGEVSDAK